MGHPWRQVCQCAGILLEQLASARKGCDTHRMRVRHLSRIISKIFNNHGGLHNRVTHRICLQPFSLHECERYAESRNVKFTRYDILEAYMVMGGSYYWSLIDKGKAWLGTLTNCSLHKTASYDTNLTPYTRSSDSQTPISRWSPPLWQSQKRTHPQRNNCRSCPSRQRQHHSRTRTTWNTAGFIRWYNNFGKKERCCISTD